MKKILVTGGTGFIGSHTVVELSQAGLEPVIVDDYSNSAPSVLEGLRAILGHDVPHYVADCNDALAMRAIFDREQLAGVIHFAASKAVGESVQQPLKYYANNLGSLTTLLRTMLDVGCPHLVFSSSCTVYGQPAHLPVSEDSPVQPAESPYGNTKRVGEEIIRDTVRSQAPIKAIALRYFNPIGAHPSARIGELPLGVPSNLVPFITQTAAGLRDQLTVFGTDYATPDGTCVRDFIHVVDLAKAHVKALTRLFDDPAPCGYDVFNIGSGQGATVLEVIKTFERVTGKPLNYRLGPRRSGDIEQIYAEATKSNTVLGWRAELTLAQALEDAWRWQLTLPNA